MRTRARTGSQGQGTSVIILFNLERAVKSTKRGLEQGLALKDRELTFVDKDLIHKDEDKGNDLKLVLSNP